MKSLVLALSLSAAAVAQDAADTVRVRGVVTVEGQARAGACTVQLWRLHEREGRAGALDKRALYERAPERAVRCDDGGVFDVRLPRGAWSAFAFDDRNGNGAWDPGVPEAAAWERRLVLDDDAVQLELVARAPTPIVRADREVEHGALRWMRGLPVVQLRGDARQRGRAHGELLGAQIVDFFRCYILEDRLGSAAAYRDFAAFLESHFDWPEPMLREVDGVLAGMRASGADLRVPELGAQLGRTELLAINAYIETRAMRSSCTQFAAWGERTAGTDVDGKTIAGRNMDGEIDFRRVTVSHFVLFAVDPSEPGQKRYVSAMWPGFVGTITGFNEAGVHCMENAGGTGPGPVVDGLVPISWTMREALATFGADATPMDFQRLLKSHANSAGGACGPGCIVVFALPHDGGGTPGWVVEGDRFGHASRVAGEVAPFVDQCLLASNHHLVYGADPDRPGTSFGREPSNSSAWRYEAGRHKLEAWARVGRNIGTAEMRELLQTVAHGTTEHSLITRPDALELDVAVASMAAEPWDAPYREWVTFRFEELFAAR